MMNVLILDDAGFGLEGGRGIYGKEIYSEILANINLKLGNTVVRAVLGAGSGSNVDVLKIKGSKLPGLRTLYDKPLIDGLSKLCKDYKIDLIHANILNARYPFAVSKVSRQLNLPLVITVHSWVYLCPTNYNVMLPNLIQCEKSPSIITCRKCMTTKAKLSDSRLFASAKMLHQTYALRSLMKKADRVISPSKAFAIKSSKNFKIEPYCIPNAVNPSMLEEEPAFEDDGSILFMGRLEHEKGVHFLQPLAEILKQFNMHVIGRGTLESIFHSSKLSNVFYHGFVTEAEKRDLIRKASVVVIPSVWYEMFGYIVSEAFIQGKPVVAFDLGGPKEQIEASSGGLLAKPFDIIDLAQKISYLLGNPSEANKMGARGRKWVETTLHPDCYAKSLVCVYNQVLGNP